MEMGHKVELHDTQKNRLQVQNPTSDLFLHGRQVYLFGLQKDGFCCSLAWCHDSNVAATQLLGIGPLINQKVHVRRYGVRVGPFI